MPSWYASCTCFVSVRPGVVRRESSVWTSLTQELAANFFYGRLSAFSWEDGWRHPYYEPTIITASPCYYNGPSPNRRFVGDHAVVYAVSSA
jgi:hypothetical protein